MNLKITSEVLVRQEKRKAFLASRELIRRLETEPETFNPQALNFISGTSVDKVAKKERWDRPAVEDGDWMAKFVGALQKVDGVRLQLEVVSKKRTFPGRAEAESLEAEYIDVPAVPVVGPALPGGESA